METLLKQNDLVNCKITFDGYDWRNLVTITSPSGKTISLTAYWGEKVSEETKDFFTELNNAWIDAKYGRGTQKIEKEISKNIMNECLLLSQGKFKK